MPTRTAPSSPPSKLWWPMKRSRKSWPRHARTPTPNNPLIFTSRSNLKWAKPFQNWGTASPTSPCKESTLDQLPLAQSRWPKLMGCKRKRYRKYWTEWPTSKNCMSTRARYTFNVKHWNTLAKLHLSLPPKLCRLNQFSNETVPTRENSTK